MLVRIGCVPFLNAKPLIEGIPELNFFPPNILAEKLRKGELDVALVPLMEVLEHPHYRILDGVCIGTKRTSRSVIVAYRKPLYEVKSVAVDAQSKTSIALAKVIFENDLGYCVDWVKDGEEADGQLMIGDRALQFRRENPNARVLDLGTAWHSRRKLPFVFAVWALSPKLKDMEPVIEMLLTAKELGLRNRNYIAANPEESAYLIENMDYDLGPEHKNAIVQFQKELLSLNLLKIEAVWEWI